MPGAVMCPCTGSSTAYAHYKLVFNQTTGTAYNNTSGYYMQIGEVKLSNSAGTIAPLPTSSGSPSTVSANGSNFSLTPDFAGTDFTLTFSTDASGWVDVGSAGNVDRLAGKGIAVSGDRSASVSLTGSLEALQSYVGTPGNIRYQVGTAQGLSMSLSSTSVNKIANNAFSGNSPTIVSGPLSYSATPINVGPVSGDGNLTVTLATSGGTLSSSVGNGTLSGVTTSGTGTNSVVLSGTASAINGYLAQSNRLSFSGLPGDYTLTATVSGADGTAVKRSALTVSSPAAVQGAATVSAAPALTLPANFNASASNGQITLAAGALGSGSGVRTVLLSISGGTLAAAANASVGLTTASSGASLSLTGTEQALSAYLATAGNLLFNGTAGQSYTLTATAQVISGGLVQSATSRQATVAAFAPVALGNGAEVATAPAILQLPQSLPIMPSSASDLVLTGIDLDDGNTGGDDSLVLTLTVASGALSAVTGGPVSVAGTATARTLTGTASQLETYLQANSVSYNGPAGALGLTLARAAAPNGASASASLNLQSAGTAHRARTRSLWVAPTRPSRSPAQRPTWKLICKPAL